MPKTVEQLQKEFDDKYITAHEIVERLQISRIAILNAKKSGRLPQPIMIPGLKTQLWVRRAIAKSLDGWERNLQDRRGRANT